MKHEETFLELVVRVLKKPTRYFLADPMAQSVTAFSLNIWLLWLAVLGQFWVFGSSILLGLQSFITWLVYKQKIRKWVGLLIGIIIITINYLSLAGAILGQFWVIASTILATWQFICLLQVCFSRPAPG